MNTEKEIREIPYPIENVVRGACKETDSEETDNGNCAGAFICRAQFTKLNTSTETTEVSFDCPETSDKCGFARRKSSTIASSTGKLMQVVMSNYKKS